MVCLMILLEMKYELLKSQVMSTAEVVHEYLTFVIQVLMLTCAVGHTSVTCLTFSVSNCCTLRPGRDQQYCTI